MNIDQGGASATSSNGRLSGVQIGSDLFAFSNWRAGLYVGQLEGDVNVDGNSGDTSKQRTGSNNLRNQYIGAYGTYAADNGFYVDTVLQSGHHNYTVAPNSSHDSKVSGNSLLGSVEVGQAFPLGTTGWSVEPQFQLIHQKLDLNGGSVSGAEVKSNTGSNWIARVGVRVKDDVKTGIGAMQPYARVNTYKSSNGTDVARFVSGGTSTDISSSTGGTSTELAAGVTIALNKSTSIYTEVGKLWSSGGDAELSSPLNASVGLRVKW